MDVRTKISFFDILVCAILILLALSVLFIGGRGDGTTVYVKTAEGDLTYDLQNDGIYPIESKGHKLSLEIKNGSVRIKDSDCPDKVCVSSGWTKDNSKLIVCAPAEVLVRIQDDGGDTDADIIAGR